MSLVVRLNRKGATLPLTIIVLALMAVGIAITFHRISAERRSAATCGHDWAPFLWPSRD